MISSFKNKFKVPLLSKDEEINLFKELLAKNESKTRDKIFNANIRLVYFLTKRLSSLEEFEDNFHEGCLGLLEAIKRFDLSKKTKFSTYARIWILSYLLKNRKQLPVIIPLDEEIFDVSQDTSQKVEEKIFLEIFKKRIQEGIKHLTKREQEIIKRKYFTQRKKSINTLSKELSISTQRIHQLNNSALIKLRKWFKDNFLLQ
jgi:RNA polymerase sigma factor (sigma-70 family)